MRDITLADTIFIAFTTRAFATGVPTVLSGTPVVSAYEDAGLTQITAGITLGVDHDSVVGLNMLTIVATGANGFEAGKDYNLVVTTGTVGGVSVVGEVVGRFTVGRSAAAVDLANGTDGLGAIKTETALIVADTNELQTDDIPGLIAALNDPTAAVIADAVWDELLAGHVTVDSAGLLLNEWQDGGRLDAILDSRMAEASINTSGGAIDSVTLVVTTTTNSDMRGTDLAFLASGAPANFSNFVITPAGAGDSLVQGYLNTLITETTPGRIAGNIDTFFENTDAATTKTVDDVGVAGSGLTQQNVRDAMKLAPTTGTPTAGSVDDHLDHIDQRTFVDTSPNIPFAQDLDLHLRGNKGITLTGGEVSTWADQSGNSNDCTQAVAANRPQPVVDSAGRQGVAFSNSSTETLFMDIPVGVSVNLANISVFAAVSFYGKVSVVNSFAAFGPSGNKGALGYWSPTATDPGFIFTSNNGGGGVASTIKEHYGLATIGYSSDATSIRFYGQTNTASATAMTGSGAGGLVGAYTTGTSCRGTLYELLVFNRALTNAESLQVIEYLKKRHGVLDITKNVVFEGDSITEGFGSTHNQNYPFYSQLRGNRVKNAGSFGHKWVDILSQGAALDANHKYAGLTNTIVAFAGTNDLVGGGRTPAQAAADAEIWAAARKAAGWDNVGMVIMLPRGTASNENDRQTYNTLLRDVAGNSWDFIIDVENDPAIGRYGANTNTTYYDADATHLNSEGHRRLAKLVDRAIEDWLNTTLDNAVTQRHVADRGVYMTIDDRQSKSWQGVAMDAPRPDQWCARSLEMIESPTDSGQYAARVPSILPAGTYLITTRDRALDTEANPGDAVLSSRWYRWNGVTIDPIDGRVYFADIKFTKDDSGATDRYAVQWFKDDASVTPVASPLPTVRVVKASDGTDLVASTNMVQIGSTGAYRHDEATNRAIAGQQYVVLITAKIDTVTQTWRQSIGRDSTL